mmetsp:Transcript_4896/g.8736  ORF Transcript_4896/g.8736 Transcript_4896/m.8736 type:complete len:121 (-) Transcript_4896:122-484(-)|eukprot:CAMPEP_0197655370 /NCGR_PEP_ID=MMETSP1338-20131121/39415_1 /TAXON_ID=43686 ORGANISM="Pelagodinium beii, Strain RCC1491" /NCGR_SAMPLE_ID=MMETSP1338 /ASSEMBLY_ACC=CAM_ASM_000754 /LENGTH=120 /DNA_ID=CAMNT_0043231005 /DNA_START=119 /DNA_END=481 /DNA_ORIENTATION=-
MAFPFPDADLTCRAWDLNKPLLSGGSHEQTISACSTPSTAYWYEKGSETLTASRSVSVDGVPADKSLQPEVTRMAVQDAAWRRSPMKRWRPQPIQTDFDSTERTSSRCRLAQCLQFLFGW